MDRNPVPRTHAQRLTLIRKAVFAIIVVTVFLSAIEIGVRWLSPSLDPDARQSHMPGWQAEFFSRSFGWHEPDPELIWRFRPNLDTRYLKTNSQGLIGTEVVTPKTDSTFRILLIGDSSPVGLGLDSYQLSFGYRLETLLGMEVTPGMRLELVNAAVSGYSSEQIRLWLGEHGWQYEPDLVILYCGNNDASISGPVSDRELLERQRLTGLRGFLNRSALYRLLTAILVSEPDGQTRETLVVRVAPERFSENLRSIADQCRKRDCPLIAVKPPVPRLWPAGLQFKLFAFQESGESSVHMPEEMRRMLGRDLRYCFDSLDLEERYGQADSFTRTVFGSAYEDNVAGPEAVSRYKQQLEGSSNKVKVHNNLGVALFDEAEYRAAEDELLRARRLYMSEHGANPTAGEIAAGSVFLYNIGYNRHIAHREGADLPGDPSIYLDSALQADYFSLRIKSEYLKAIDSLKGNGVLVADAPRLFDQHNRERLFVDHCHPTAEGHRLIADQLLDIMRVNKLLPR